MLTSRTASAAAGGVAHTVYDMGSSQPPSTGSMSQHPGVTYMGGARPSGSGLSSDEVRTVSTIRVQCGTVWAEQLAGWRDENEETIVCVGQSYFVGRHLSLSQTPIGSHSASVGQPYFVIGAYSGSPHRSHQLILVIGCAA